VTSERRIAAYGEWESTVSVDAAAADSGGSNWPQLVDGVRWWCRSDPATATVRLLRDGADVLAARWSVRNRYQGYGGRPYTARGDRVVFTETSDQRLYSWRDGEQPVALTAPPDAGEQVCWAEPQLLADGTVVVLREVTRDPAGPDDADPAPRTRRSIVAIDPSGAISELAASHHFLACPRVSPDGRSLAWIGWDHPQMPWDGTVAMVADRDGSDARAVLGSTTVSVVQVEWAPDGALYALADPNGWWNLHRVDIATGMAENVLPRAEECGGPMWSVGNTWFAVVPDGRVVVQHGAGDQQLSVWAPADGSLTALAPGCTQFGNLAVDDTTVLVRAGSPSAAMGMLACPLDGGAPTRLDATPDEIEHAVAQRRVISVDGRDVHVIWYPPTSPDHAAPDGARPPLLVHAHGGPTGGSNAVPDSEFDVFTSRGFAVASVEYGGSTGFGRDYRERLRHGWGVVDRDDCVGVARALAEAGEVDGARMAVRGGSAGGWTTLACLTGSDVFCAGAVYYPISDALHWSGGDTHDFESRYLIGLIGPLPEARERYEAVSPLAHVDRISAPLVMLQGADDFICPPHHAEVIVEAVAARGLWHKMQVFAGEGHGFRKASSVRDSLLAELELYTHAMGLEIHV
jgi:dipeptidyl aminopeptidase/acylaminoacyl peptidase